MTTSEPSSVERSEGVAGDRRTSGPLAGLRVIELAGLGPGPFCAMVLADLGAEVIRLERTGIPASVVGAVDRRMVLTRGRHAIGVDLKRQRGVELVLDMVEHADVLLEGFRPGVVERIGLGPSVCLQRNPRLIYGRITGYGREGPLAAEAGHDINYISVAGALAPIGRRGEAPVPPLNLVADFGGGGMLLAMGILAAVYERTRSGLGQVVDAAMVDGAALLTTMFHQIRGLSLWHDERGTNSMDTGSHYYNVYETSDGEFLSVGAMEPRFYRSFMKGLGFSEEDIPPQDDQTQWESLTSRVARDPPEPDKSRVVGDIPRYRRLCDSGVVARRGSHPSAQPCPGHVRRRRRHRGARPRATLQSHASPPSISSAGPRRACHPGARTVGTGPGPDRPPGRGGGRRLTLGARTDAGCPNRRWVPEPTRGARIVASLDRDPRPYPGACRARR